MYLQPIPQHIVLLLLVVFTGLGFLAGVNNAPTPAVTTDLNNDGEVTFADFSIALYLVEQITDELKAK